MNTKRVLFAFVLILFVVAFSSCFRFGGCYIPPDIEINLTQSNDSVFPGESVIFKIALTPDVEERDELGYFKIEIADSTIYDTLLSGTATVELEYTYMVDSCATGDNEIFLRFSATGGASGFTSSEYTLIYVKPPPPLFGPMLTGQGTVSYSSTNVSTELGWQLTADEKGGINITIANSDDADIVFFFNDSYRQQILSPDAPQITNHAAYSSWSYDLDGKKTTKFAPATSADLDNATAESIDAISISTSTTHTGGGNGIENIQLNDVYFFELSDGRKGMFKVIDNDPPYKIESGITLDFKWQGNIGETWSGGCK